MAKVGGVVLSKSDELPWGRKVHSTFSNQLFSLTLVVVCPLWLATTWITLEHFDASFTSTYREASTQGYVPFMKRYAPRPDWPSTIGYALWILFQAALYTFLPGPLSIGQVTPAGHLLKYRTNGLLAWIVTHVAAIAAASFGYLNLSVIADHFEGLLVAASGYGYVLSLAMTIKGHVSPSYDGDRKLSGMIAVFLLYAV